MKFEEREVQNPNRKRLYKIDQETGEQLPFEDSILVDIESEEGDVLNQHFGTPISAENLNKSNWRDDESLSFKNRSEDGLPDGVINTTQIVTADDGKTYLVKENGNAIEISGDSQAKSTLDFIYPFTTATFELSDNDKYKISTPENGDTFHFRCTAPNNYFGFSLRFHSDSAAIMFYNSMGSDGNEIGYGRRACIYDVNTGELGVGAETSSPKIDINTIVTVNDKCDANATEMVVAGIPSSSKVCTGSLNGSALTITLTEPTTTKTVASGTHKHIKSGG